MASVSGVDLRVLQLREYLERYWTSKTGRCCDRVGTALADDQSQCVVAVSLTGNCVLETTHLVESSEVLSGLLITMPQISIRDNMLQLEYSLRLGDSAAHDSFMKASMVTAAAITTTPTTTSSSSSSLKRTTFGSDKRFRVSDLFHH